MQYRKFGKLDWKVSALCWLLFINGSLTKGKSGITHLLPIYQLVDLISLMIERFWILQLNPRICNQSDILCLEGLFSTQPE
jgi:hypothetical protein